jgi:regulator of replication initiation timing
MSKTAVRGVDLEPIDRLEEKVKLLVGLVDRMKADQARAGEENQSLRHEVESLKSKSAAHESIGVELSTLREERDTIRTRVTEMLEQLEALNL